MDNTIKNEIQTVINKAWNDDQFRRVLVNSPKMAIKSATGLDIPEGVKLIFNDQTDPNKMYINIPPKPDFDNMELSDEQLEQVAGGEILVSVILGSIAAGIATGIGVAAVGATAIGVGASAGVDAGW